MAQYPNLYNVELTKGPAVVQLQQMFLGDVKANRIGAIVTENGEAVTLGGTCSGTAILSNGGTVSISGTVSGNTCYIDLPSGVYAVEGPVSIFLNNVSGENTTTLVAAFGNVCKTQTGTVIDPGTVIPSVSALIDAIDAAVASIPADYTALLAAVAPTFSASNNYTAGRYVWYSGNLYRFTADHAAGSWVGTDAVQVVVTNEIADLKSAINADGININDGNAVLHLVENSYVETNGTITPYNSWSRTDYIPVYNQIKVYSKYSSQYCQWFKSDKTPLSPQSITAGTNILTVPTNAAFFMVSNQTSRMQTVKIESLLMSHIEKIESDVDNGYIIKPNGVNDMKTAIETALNNYGKAVLQSGSYYITGIDMPSNSSIFGCGENTKVYLLNSVTDGACVTANSNNTIENIAFYQYDGYNNKPASSTIGTVDGIRILNEASICRVSNCSFYGFKRAGIYGNTVGHDSYHSIIIDNCNFMYCEIGVYFDYRTEYAMVSNSTCSQCYNGTRNDGGNNLFVGCHFDGNNSAFVTNTVGFESANDGHGSCVGCTFNHSDNYAFYQRGGSHGFVFVGCHFYYGGIYLRSCTGIVFDGCQFDGSEDITFYQGKGHRFVNCSFVQTPTFTEENATHAQNVRVINCYLLDGSAEVVYQNVS